VRLRHAIALGLVHGPAERAPVSSSAHATLVPWLMRWRCDELEPAARKRFEVALHAGATAAALARRRDGDSPAPMVVGLACAAPAIAGAALERTIERRLGTPATIAAGLVAGAIAMAAAERRPERGRRVAQAGASDGFALGVAQTLALIPGVSRSGATRAAARARGFGPREARALSDAAGLPITIGAVALKARELRAAGARELPALAAGAGAAFASTLLADALLDRGERGASLRPYAAYRVALAAAVAWRLRHNPRG